jgi:hypothetical protein
MAAGLAPISYASTIIGFISFAITLLTLAGMHCTFHSGSLWLFTSGP